MKRRGELTTEEKNLITIKISDEDAFEKFERSMLLRNIRPATIRYYHNELKATKAALKSAQITKQIVELTQKDIESLILFLKEKIKVVSINTRLRVLKSFFNFLYENDHIKTNPIKNIKKLRDREKVMETLDDDEIIKLCRHMKGLNTFVGYRDYVLFLVMLDTGIRLSELVGIQIEDVRKKDIIIRITKNQKERMVYPSNKVKGELEVYLKLRGDLPHNHLFINVDNELLQPRGIQSRFEKYRKELKIEKKPQKRATPQFWNYASLLFQPLYSDLSCFINL